MAIWVSIERVMHRLAELTYSDLREGHRINSGPIPSFLARDKTIDKSLASEIDQLRQIRNEIVHGKADYKSVLTADLLKSMKGVLTALEKKLAGLKKNEKKK